MASSEVDQKFLGRFAENIGTDNPLLSSMLFKVLGLSVILAKQLVRARKLRKADPIRAARSLDLYFHILWLAREGLVMVEQYILPMVAGYGELKVFSYKLRASFYHIFVTFHNTPSVNPASTTRQITTPPGFSSPKPLKIDKGKAPDRGTPIPDTRSSSVQPTHALEGGPVGGLRPDGFDFNTPPPNANFLLPARNYIPTALECFQEASDLAESVLWGSHPLRLSVKVEFCAFLYDCMHDAEACRRLAKTTIAEVYNAQEGMDDDMFEDAADLVGTLGRMMKRGLGSGTQSTPGMSRVSMGRTEGMDNPI